MARRGGVESYGVEGGKVVRRNPPRRRKGRASADALAQVRATNFSEKQYRGYWIKTNAMTGDMWIEKDGFLIGRVPASESWGWAEKAIDQLVGPASNPPLVAFSNPPGRVVAVLSGRVYSIAYRHLDDGKDYKHDFKAGVAIQLLDDGSIRVYQESGKPLFRDF